MKPLTFISQKVEGLIVHLCMYKKSILLLQYLYIAYCQFSKYILLIQYVFLKI